MTASATHEKQCPKILLTLDFSIRAPGSQHQLLPQPSLECLIPAFGATDRGPNRAVPCPWERIREIDKTEPGKSPSIKGDSPHATAFSHKRGEILVPVQELGV